MKTKLVLIFLFLAATAFAQQPPQAPPGQPGPRPPASTPRPGDHDFMADMHQNLFPPDFVMRNRQAINLTNEQSEFIKNEVLKSQSKFTELQWQMMSEQENASTLLKADHVDETAALAELDKILNLEREIKRAQLGLVIRIKNKLTPDQLAKLRQLKQQGGAMATPHPEPPGGDE